MELKVDLEKMIEFRGERFMRELQIVRDVGEMATEYSEVLEGILSDSTHRT